MQSVRDLVRDVNSRRAVVAVGAIVLAAVFLAGCCSPAPATAFGQSIWGDFKETKSWMNAYKHMVLVCIYEDHWEDRGPHEYSLHHFKTTVVRSYKGKWQPSEKLAFVHGVDAPVKSEVNAQIGQLLYVFTNERTSNEFGLDTGEFLGYNHEIDRQLRLVFAKQDEP